MKLWSTRRDTREGQGTRLEHVLHTFASSGALRGLLEEMGCNRGLQIVVLGYAILTVACRKVPIPLLPGYHIL